MHESNTRKPEDGIEREALAGYLDTLLETARIKDYCPNGLQVEGRRQIRCIVGGVTASLALIETAVARQADALLVHHGLFWRGDSGRVTGFRKRRLQMLLGEDINLFAFHLPLDMHPTLGNNAQLAMRMGWSPDGRFGDDDIGWLGHTAKPTTVAVLTAGLSRLLSRQPLVVGEPDRPIKRLAWCSGGAQNYFEAAIEAGADAFVSGEISEPTVHLARETGTAYFSAGHHATERFGVMALLDHLSDRFGLECQFVDIDNPV